MVFPLAAAFFLAMAIPAFAEWELGLGWTPNQNANDISNPSAVNSILSFHVGYAWHILYLSWDAYAMPDYWVSDMTGSSYYVPGFLNLFDVGARVVLRPVLAYVEAGANSLYIYGGQIYGDVGVNARAGVGLKFGWWGFNVSGTQVFSGLTELSAAVQNAAHGNWSTLTDGSLVSLNFAIYLGEGSRRR
jgi:hypothetical protein